MTTPPEKTCPICMIIAEKRYIERHENGVFFIPDNNALPGHIIAAPLVHMPLATGSPVIAAQLVHMIMKRQGIGQLGTTPFTVVFAVGEEVGQLAPHMYAHVIPQGAKAIIVPNELQEKNSV